MKKTKQKKITYITFLKNKYTSNGFTLTYSDEEIWKSNQEVLKNSLGKTVVITLKTDEKAATSLDMSSFSYITSYIKYHD